MATDTHADMHRDHHTWQSELAMWRDDIEIWKNEYEAATDQALLDPTLQKYGRVIREHAKIVRQHEESLAAHERAVAEFERAGRGDELQLLALAKAHPKEAITHAQLREAHEHVKKQHNAVMAEWSLLHKPPGDLSSQASTKGRMPASPEVMPTESERAPVEGQRHCQARIGSRVPQSDMDPQC